MNNNKKIGQEYTQPKKRANLAKKESVQNRRRDSTITKQVILKNVSRSRRDISHWNNAIKSATNIEKPRRVKLYQLYDDILLDGHLSSQMVLRKSFIEAAPYTIKYKEKDDDELKELFSESIWFGELLSHILDTRYYGHSLIELSFGDDRELNVSLVPRANIVPQKGEFLPDYTSDNGIPYRELREFKTWLLEIGNPDDLGLLCKAVPHVLFKRFAQSCWVELCEIFGIPPRVLKTDTTNPERMAQAEKMMQEMGSAGWMILDTDEALDFAKGVVTDGAIYDKLMDVCRNEISLIVMGAVLGQDTKNGNRSKEEVSMDLLTGLIQSDKNNAQKVINTVVIPALVRLGIVPDGTKFVFQKEIDTFSLWEQVKTALPYVEFDIEWLNTTFGMKIKGFRGQFTQSIEAEPKQEKLSADTEERFFV